MSPLTDVHSHFPAAGFKGIRIFNWNPEHSSPSDGWFSAGLHPWNVENPSAGDWWKSVLSVVVEPRCLAIGETGIDRYRPIPVPLQTEWFTRHLSLARETGKPLIVHNVRGHQDLIPLLKKSPHPVVLHGFRGNESVTSQWLRLPSVWFSAGSILLRAGSDQQASFRMIPRHRLLLESDDRQTPIEETLLWLAGCRQENPILIQEQVYFNFITLFPSVVT
ncbi:MAG: TatD family hydrolase [Bacteroidetes bacterium]|nr:TatD family hydrolase [Bacteroidota bacterium]